MGGSAINGLPTSLISPTLSSWTAYTPTTQGFGTVSNVQVFWRRVGDTIEVAGKFLVGTTTATEARVYLPNGLISDGNKIPSLRICGTYATNGVSGVGNPSYYTLIEGNVGYFTFGFQHSSSAPLNKQNGNAVFYSAADGAFTMSCPVSNWGTLSFVEPQAVSFGSGAPTSTPSFIGQSYIDTVGKRNYKAYGTASSADWRKEPIFASGVATVNSDRTVDLGFNWSGGFLTVHNSSSTSNYLDTNVLYGTFETSYESLTNAAYTGERHSAATDYNTLQAKVVGKNANTSGSPKSATLTSFTLDYDGVTTAYVKWFVWA